MSEIEQLRADLARVTAERDRLLKREEHFASVLRVTDRGQYRADWDSAIRRVVAERDALRAIVEGREEPPAREEIAAHGGPWLVLREPGEYDVVYSTLALMLRRQDVEHHGRPVRWWPLRDGQLCAWPVVEVVPPVGGGRG